MKYRKKKNRRHASSVMQQREELLFNRYTAKQANRRGVGEDERLEEDSANGAKDHGKVKGGRSPAKERRMS